jgi:hypothetical protein
MARKTVGETSLDSRGIDHDDVVRAADRCPEREEQRARVDERRAARHALLVDPIADHDAQSAPEA